MSPWGFRWKQKHLRPERRSISTVSSPVWVLRRKLYFYSVNSYIMLYQNHIFMSCSSLMFLQEALRTNFARFSREKAGISAPGWSGFTNPRSAGYGSFYHITVSWWAPRCDVNFTWDLFHIECCRLHELTRQEGQFEARHHWGSPPVTNPFTIHPGFSKFTEGLRLNKKAEQANDNIMSKCFARALEDKKIQEFLELEWQMSHTASLGVGSSTPRSFTSN